MNVRDRLTINQAFSQPWIREKVYRSETLSQAQANIAATQPTVADTQTNIPDTETEENDIDTNED